MDELDGLTGSGEYPILSHGWDGWMDGWVNGRMDV